MINDSIILHLLKSAGALILKKDTWHSQPTRAKKKSSKQENIISNQSITWKNQVTSDIISTLHEDKDLSSIHDPLSLIFLIWVLAIYCQIEDPETVNHMLAETLSIQLEEKLPNLSNLSSHPNKICTWFVFLTEFFNPYRSEKSFLFTELMKKTIDRVTEDVLLFITDIVTEAPPHFSFAQTTEFINIMEDIYFADENDDEITLWIHSQQNNIELHQQFKTTSLIQAADQEAHQKSKNAKKNKKKKERQKKKKSEKNNKQTQDSTVVKQHFNLVLQQLTCQIKVINPSSLKPSAPLHQQPSKENQGSHVEKNQAGTTTSPRCSFELSIQEDTIQKHPSLSTGTTHFTKEPLKNQLMHLYLLTQIILINDFVKTAPIPPIFLIGSIQLSILLEPLDGASPQSSLSGPTQPFTPNDIDLLIFLNKEDIQSIIHRIQTDQASFKNRINELLHFQEAAQQGTCVGVHLYESTGTLYINFKLETAQGPCDITLMDQHCASTRRLFECDDAWEISSNGDLKLPKAIDIIKRDRASLVPTRHINLSYQPSAIHDIRHLIKAIIDTSRLSLRPLSIPLENLGIDPKQPPLAYRFLIFFNMAMASLLKKKPEIYRDESVKSIIFSTLVSSLFALHKHKDNPITLEEKKQHDWVIEKIHQALFHTDFSSNQTATYQPTSPAYVCG